MPLVEKFGGMRLMDITAQHSTTYQLVRIEKVSPGTCNLELKVIRQLLKAARLWRRSADDYTPLKENSRGPGRALTPEEETRLFECAQKRPDQSAAYYAGIVAANTTMRGCELKGFQLQEVDRVNRTVAIRRNSTTTDAGCRRVPLNPAALWALTRLVERATLLRADKPEHFLFPAFRYKHTKESGVPGSDFKRDGSRPGLYDPTKPHGVLADWLANPNEKSRIERTTIP